MFILLLYMKGISQRECTTYFPFLKSMRQSITATLEEYFFKFIKDTFPLETCTEFLNVLYCYNSEIHLIIPYCRYF